MHDGFQIKGPTFCKGLRQHSDQRHQEEEREGLYRSERSYGSFYRTILLPEGVNTEKASATFRDGVLQIELPAPSQQSRGRTLEIKGDTTGSTGDGGHQQQR